MKTWISYIILISPLVLLAYDLEPSPLLTWQDSKWLQERNNNGPHLSSASDDEYLWESFDIWQCFNTENINIECVTYAESIIVPGLVINDGDRTLLFDTPTEDKLDCKETGDSWSELLRNSTRACIMAAEMPGVFAEAEETSLWYIHAIKTDSGYWIKN